MRDPVDLCAMAIKDFTGPTVLNPGLHFSQCEFSPILGTICRFLFLALVRGVGGDCAMIDRLPRSSYETDWLPLKIMVP